MQRKHFYFLITLAVLFSFACGSDEEASVTPKTSTPAEEFLRQADDLYSQRMDFTKLREAIRILHDARVFYPENFEIAWKLAKYEYFLGKHTEDGDECDRAFKDGIDYGRIATRLDPAKPDGHFWLGANLGGQAQKYPLTKGIVTVGEIRETMNKVIEIQPDYQGASAFLALGQIELASGDPNKAIPFLEKALALKQDNAYVYVDLGRAYLLVHRLDDAKQTLLKVLRMKSHPDYVPEYNDASAQAKQILKGTFNLNV
jgi:tetratricopeptide (TPR) repeat protein